MLTTNALTYCVVSDGLLGYRGLYYKWSHIWNYESPVISCQHIAWSVCESVCLLTNDTIRASLVIQRTCFAINSSSDGQNGRHVLHNILRWILINGQFCILINISPKFVTKGPIDNSPTLVRIMAWRRLGDKPLSELLLTRFTDAYMRH